MLTLPTAQQLPFRPAGPRTVSDRNTLRVGEAFAPENSGLEDISGNPALKNTSSQVQGRT